MKKSIRHRVQEFWCKDPDTDSQDDKAFSARHSGTSKEKGGDQDESSSSEFNLDEEADMMFEDNIESKKKKPVKDGGYRDYSIDKTNFDSVKLIYKSHDHTMAKSKTFTRAKLAALNRSKDASLSLNFMRGTQLDRKKTDDSNEAIPENILDDFSLKVPLRTPNLESALVEDMKCMENQDNYSQKRDQLITEKELPEYTGLARRGSDYLFGTRFSDDESIFPHSPIGVKNSTSIRLYINSRESNFTKQANQVQPKQKSLRTMELPKKKFIGISSVLIRNQVAIKDDYTIVGDYEEKGDYSPTSRLPYVHNSMSFNEILPYVLGSVKLTDSIPEISMSLPNRKKRTGNKSSFSFVREKVGAGEISYDNYSRMSKLDSPGGDISLSSGSPNKQSGNFLHFINRLNRTDNASLEHIGWSPSSAVRDKLRITTDSLDSPIGELGLKNILVNDSGSSSNKQSKAVVNLNRLMNQLRGHCQKPSRDFHSPSKISNEENSKNSNNRSDVRNNKAGNEILNIEGFQLHDMSMDSDRTLPKSTTNKYMQVIKSLRLSATDQTEERMSVNTVKTIPDISGNSSPYIMLKRGHKAHTVDSKETPFIGKRARALDLITDLSIVFLLDSIQTVFEDTNLEPFVVVLC